MAITNQDRVGKAMELLKDGLQPFVERELRARDAQGWLDIVRQSVSETQLRLFQDPKGPKWDVAALLAVLWNQWNTIFGRTLGRAERSLVQELRDCRNKWAHQEPFSSDDADRALDSMARLLTAVSSPQADEVQKMKLELRRLTYDEQVRSEKRKAGGSLIEAAATGSLKPWR
ncbi:MAG TPA: Swt1 family HEPN domain-containing protein, partial [Terrimesophilobacter sp.]|nr:Swt1 family HEPN domain-containing protein [Terrimesophilobacter sp.]